MPSVTDDWTKTDSSRRDASAAALRLHPLTWVRRRLRRREGMSTRYGVPGSKAEVLERLSALPVSLWSYGYDDESVRHLGPMAQDFARAFGLGDSDVSINTLDAAGVCMAAIQALHERVVELEAEVDRLRERQAPAPPQPTS